MVPAAGFPTGRLSILNNSAGSDTPKGAAPEKSAPYFSARLLRSTGTPGPMVEASATFWT